MKVSKKLPHTLVWNVFMDVGQSQALQAVVGGTLRIQDIHTHPFFLTVFAASLVGWVTGMTKGFNGTKDWLMRYWSAPPAWITFILDLFVFGVVGAYFGTGLFNPSSFQAASTAGFLWPIALQALTSKRRLTSRTSSREFRRQIDSEISELKAEEASTSIDMVRTVRIYIQRIWRPILFFFVTFTIVLGIVFYITSGNVPTVIKAIFAPGWIALRWIGIIETLALLTILFKEVLSHGDQETIFSNYSFLFLLDIIILVVIGITNPFASTLVSRFFSWHGMILSLFLFTLLLWDFFDRSSYMLITLGVVDIAIVLAVWSWLA